MKAAILIALPAAAISIPAHAADRTEQVAGWALTDVGGKPGNDLNREVAMVRKGAGAEITYKAGPGRSGTVSAKFSGCDSASEYAASLEFKNDEDAIKSVREEIAYDFAEFRKTCSAVTLETEKTVMEGFDKAFGAIMQWVKDKPFVYPPNEAPVAPQRQSEAYRGDTI